MPGPGGGSHGGGGRSGGFGGGHHGGGFGGGHHGGGFGGGHHGPRPGGFGPRPHHPPHHHRPFMGGWGWYGPRRRGYGGGGGCLGGMVAMIMMPVILIIVLLGLIGSCSNNVYDEYGYESIQPDYYDEEMFQDYADEQYAKAFGQLDTYEDNLLLVVVTEETNSEYAWIAWVGDHIHTDISWLFGDEESVLGEVLTKCINADNYKYSLDSNLVDVLRMMSTEIKHLELESSYDCTEERATFESHLVNNTALPLTEQTVNDALADFTEFTGIPTVIVVAEAEEVFGKEAVQGGQHPNAAEPAEQNSWSIGGVLLVVGVVILAVVLIVNLVNRKKQQSETDPETAARNKRYSEFDDQYQ